MHTTRTPQMKSWLQQAISAKTKRRRHSILPVGNLFWLAGWCRGYRSSNKEVLGLFHDDGIYAVVAKSLSDGSGYRIISLPTDVRSNEIPVSLFFCSLLAVEPRPKVSHITLVS